MHQPGEGKLVDLQADLDREFPDRGAEPVGTPPDPRAGAPRAEQPTPGAVATEGTAPAEPPTTAAAAGAPGESASERPVIRIVGGGKGRGAHDDIAVRYQTGDTDLQPPAAKPGPSATDTSEEALARRELDHAHALLRAHDYDRALASLTTYLARWPDGPGAEAARFASAECYLGRGELLAAVDAFEGVLTRSPQGPLAAESLLRLGQLTQRLGRQDAAHAYFERLATEFPQSDSARHIPRSLAAP
jgi:TolA-binding protein